MIFIAILAVLALLAIVAFFAAGWGWGQGYRAGLDEAEILHKAIYDRPRERSYSDPVVALPPPRPPRPLRPSYRELPSDDE